ncbi:MAG: hypothetical protein HRT74_05805 [Flavobacteriales bacterium]|nr:hypothetical protein [Flavobacteriales bacterium]
MKSKWLFAMCAVVALASCKKDDPEEEVMPPASLDYRSGVLVSNEGAFGASNGSISWISGGSITNDLFNNVNSFNPGDVVQSMARHNDRGYVVVNNGSKVEVVNLKDFTSVGTISGCDYPRYFMGVDDNKGYLTNGSTTGHVMVVDLTTLQITSQIEVGQGPEKMAYNGTYVFVANSGGWAFDNRVAVIDPATDQVVQFIEVGDRPQDIVVDSQNNVWVMCAGDTEYDENWQIINETESTLVKINSSTLAVDGTVTVGVVGDHAKHLEVSPDGATIYVENNGVTPLSVSNGEFGSTLINDDLHSIHVNPNTGEIYGTSVPDYVSPNDVIRFSASGAQEATFEAGIAPNHMVFE